MGGKPALHENTSRDQYYKRNLLHPPAPPTFPDFIDIFSRSHACSHNRSPIGPALEANANGWIRSIGAHLNISQQGRDNRLSCHSGGLAGARHGSWKRLHTERDKSRLEMAELCGFRAVAASQSKMTCDLNSTKSPVFWGFTTNHFRVTREPAELQAQGADAYPALPFLAAFFSFFCAD